MLTSFIDLGLQAALHGGDMVLQSGVLCKGQVSLLLRC